MVVFKSKKNFNKAMLIKNNSMSHKKAYIGTKIMD